MMVELDGCPLFEDLSQSALNDIRNHGDKIQLNRGDVLFEKNDPGDQIYIILEGLIQVSVPDPLSDKDKTLTLLGEKQFLGEMAILTGKNRSGRAEALKDSQLFSFSGEFFVRMTQQHPNLALNLSRILGHRLWDTDSEMQRVAFNTVQSRLASQLLRLADKFGEEDSEGIKIDFSLTHEMLADLVGTYRETITKKINEFKRKDILDDKDGNLVIAKQDRLENIANI